MFCPIYYDVDFQIVTQSQTIDSVCNSISFVNQGTASVTIKGALLQQGQQLQIPGNLGEIDTTNYLAVFDESGGGTKQLLVIRKMYKQTQA